MLTMRTLAIQLSILGCLLLAACSSGSTVTDQQPEPAGANGLEWSAALPEDVRFPWEELDGSGFVVPQERSSSAINAETEFVSGADTFSTSPGAIQEDLSLQLPSNSGEMQFGIYRVVLGGETPGTVSADVNLASLSSEYWLSVADYGSGRWRTFGPFSDSHVRISLPEGDWLSGLGNLFVAVLTYGGGHAQVVGIGVNPTIAGDTTAPPAPDAPQLTAVEGGLLIEWLDVVAEDLAGYRIYYRSGTFIDQSAPGVRQVGYLEGLNRHLLSGLSSNTFVRISALDTSGNESALSDIVSALPLAGAGGDVLLTADTASAKINDTITLTAFGAESYDFDLDGDGDFDITGNTSGSVQADTTQTGLVRPTVRGTNSGGTSVALGGVSLIVAVNVPPVAILTADKYEGTISDGETTPLEVAFDAGASYDDDSGLLYAFDLDGNGEFGAENSTPERTAPYETKGAYLAAVRVTDSDGLVDYAAVLIKVYQVTDFRSRFLKQGEVGGINQFISFENVDGHPAFAFLMSAGPDQGAYYVRALDEHGTLWGDAVLLDDQNSSSTGLFIDLAVINGNPAAAYMDSSDSELRYIRAGNSTGQTQADWTNSPVDIVTTFTMSSQELDLEFISGQPAIAYGVNTNGKYIRATGATGTGNTLGEWGNAPINISTEATGISYTVDLEVVNFSPAISYVLGNELRYVRSTTNTGVSALDWPGTTVKISGAQNVGPYHDMKVVSGNPAVAFWDVTALPGVGYLRSTTVNGADIGDWPAPVGAYADPVFGSSGYVKLAVIGGIPAITHYCNTISLSTICYLTSKDAIGSLWNDQTPVVTPEGPFGNYYGLAEVDGMPAIGGTGLGQLVYAAPDKQL